MKKVSCIIPAHNEQSRIGRVLEVVSAHPLIDEVIAIDDGSTDDTKLVIAEYKNIRLIVHKKNRGKSEAVYTGIKVAQGEFLFLLDADLTGLTPENITDLLTPVLHDKADISISMRKNSPKIWKIIGLDYISGERVFPQKMLASRLEELLRLPHFGLEVFLNDVIITNHYRIKVVIWSEVVSPFKYKKYGLLKGTVGDIRMMRDIFKTVSVFRPVYQILKMLSLKIK